MIGGCKPVDQMHVWIEFDKALAELRCAVPAPVSGDEIDVPFVIDGGRLTGLPNARFLSAWRCIEDADLLQRSCVVAQQESMIGTIVTVRRIANEHIPSGEEEPRALVLPQRAAIG